MFRYSDPDTLVITVHATDHDTEPFNRDVSYALEAGDNTGAVVLNGKTGELRVTDVLREAKARLQLRVTATDRGTPRLLGRTNVTLRVRNISGTPDGGRRSETWFLGQTSSNKFETVCVI